jgi:hypothetical protein
VAWQESSADNGIMAEVGQKSALMKPLRYKAVEQSTLSSP